jgi:hypothetical protein
MAIQLSSETITGPTYNHGLSAEQFDQGVNGVPPELPERANVQPTARRIRDALHDSEKQFGFGITDVEGSRCVLRRSSHQKCSSLLQTALHSHRAVEHTIRFIAPWMLICCVLMKVRAM